jgi:hypothetical protein
LLPPHVEPSNEVCIVVAVQPEHPLPVVKKILISAPLIDAEVIVGVQQLPVGITAVLPEIVILCPAVNVVGNVMVISPLPE